MNRTQRTSRRPPMTFQDRKRGDGGGGLRFHQDFLIFRTMIFDLKRYVDLREGLKKWKFKMAFALHKTTLFWCRENILKI